MYGHYAKSLESTIQKCEEACNLYPTIMGIEGATIQIKEFTGGRLDGYMEDRYLAPKSPIKIPVLIMDNQIWMSVTPMEVESHETHIRRAKGHVLVAGLGMGYYINEIAQKEEVETITVIEKDPRVISMFDAYSMDWENREKIEIIEDDIYNVDIQDMEFDYVYIDIWPDMVDDNYDSYSEIIDSGFIKCKDSGFWGEEKVIMDCLTGYLEDDYLVDEGHESTADIYGRDKVRDALDIAVKHGGVGHE